jgi:hypothetical protein
MSERAMDRGGECSTAFPDIQVFKGIHALPLNLYTFNFSRFTAAR